MKKLLLFPGAETFRRSMPDLASRRLSASAASGRTLSLAPPINLLKSKAYHTSDTRLVHAGSNSRLSMLPTNGFGYNRNTRNQSPDRSSSSSVETNNLLPLVLSKYSVSFFVFLFPNLQLL